METDYCNGGHDPARDSDVPHWSVGTEGKRRIKEKCQAMAAGYGLTPPPKSRRALFKLLVEKFGAADAVKRMRSAGISVPKKTRNSPRGRNRKAIKITPSNIDASFAAYHKKQEKERAQWLKDHPDYVEPPPPLPKEDLGDSPF